MSFFRKRSVVLLSLVASITALALDKDKGKFTPPALASIRNKASDGGLTIAAMAYDTASLASSAFGKLNPNQHGVLPILLIVQNDSKQSVKLDQMKVKYVDPDRKQIDATPAPEVPLLYGPRRPNFNPSPIPGINLNRKKNPLAASEIQKRAFEAKSIPVSESAHGFLYFQTNHRRGAKLYITGLQEEASGKELLYFDVPLD